MYREQDWRDSQCQRTRQIILRRTRLVCKPRVEGDWRLIDGGNCLRVEGRARKQTREKMRTEGDGTEKRTSFT